MRSSEVWSEVGDVFLTCLIFIAGTTLLLAFYGLLSIFQVVGAVGVMFMLYVGIAVVDTMSDDYKDKGD